MKKKITKLLTHFILKLKNFNSAESIIIFSEARGGSTWLMELMHNILPSCINWEPLHVDKGVVSRDLNLGWRPFLTLADNSPEYYKLFKNIHEYKIHSEWTRKYLTLKNVLKSKFVITKYVRGNMLVPYLSKTFQFNHQPIFLLRHPIDTRLSQIKAFTQSYSTQIKVGVPSCINNERFITHLDFLKTLESDLEIKIAKWCLNNCYAIENLDTSKVCVVYYSDLLLNPQDELKRILAALNLNKYAHKIDRIKFNKASSTDFRGDFKTQPQEQLNKNFQKLDQETKDRIQHIFDHFNFKVYNAYSSEPNKEILFGKN